MKTVCKKLLTLMLVAVMLVTAVPFQALAADTTGDGAAEATVTIQAFKKAGEELTAVGEATVEKVVPGTSYTKDALVAKVSAPENTTLSHVRNVTAKANVDDSVTIEGDTEIRVIFKTVEAPKPETYNANVIVKAGDEEANYNLGQVSAVAYADLVKYAFKDTADAYYTLNSVMDASGNAVSAGTAVALKGDTTFTVNMTKYSEKTITWHFKDGSTTTTKTVKGVIATVVDAPNVEKYSFKEWNTSANGTGSVLVNNNPQSDYYAIYTKDATGGTDGVSSITVWARIYTNDDEYYRLDLFTDTGVADGTNVLTYLNAQKDRIYNKVFDKVSSDDYEWNMCFYNNNDGGALVDQDDVLDGDSSYYVKIKANDDANVLIYIHKKYDNYPAKIVAMYNYAAGQTLYKSDVVAKVKKSYTVKSENVLGLYTEDQWGQILNGQHPTSQNSIKIKDNETTIVHVYLKNATASGSTSTSDNPKTGDTMFVTMGVLGVSATALAVLFFLNKKKYMA